MKERESYLEYLPQVLQAPSEEPAPAQGIFLTRFLHIFEHGFAEIESKVDDIPKLFDPWQADKKLLPWLASWVALNLPEDWPEPAKRALIDRIVSLYRKRGLPEGLRTYLRLYTGLEVEIDENTKKPHIFRVGVDFRSYGFKIKRLAGRAREMLQIIHREKPAHTHYELDISSCTMQIGAHSTIGDDTILGTRGCRLQPISNSLRRKK